MSSNAKQLANVTHVIFDLDGLLLNTEDIYQAVFDEMAVRFAHRHFSIDGKAQVQGRCLTEGEQLMKERYGIRESLDEIDRTAHELLDSLLPSADLMAGAEQLVKHFYENGIPMAIATGSDPQGFALKTARNKEFFAKYFQHIVMAGDPAVKHGKPAPDVFLAAADRFKNPPASRQHVMVFDDAFLGIKGALAAGMPCVWIPSIRGLDTSTLPATLALTTLEDFRPELFGLPPFPSDTPRTQRRLLDENRKSEIEDILVKKRELRMVSNNISENCS